MRARRPVAAIRRPLGAACAIELTLSLVALLTLAGCGGGSSAPTKSQYIAKVNAICATEQQRLMLVGQSGGKLLGKISESVGIREQAIAKIEALKSPTREAISPEWLQLRKRALSASKKISPRKLRSSEAREANSAFIVSYNGALRLARAYGLTSCRGFAAV